MIQIVKKKAKKNLPIGRFLKSGNDILFQVLP